MSSLGRKFTLKRGDTTKDKGKGPASTSENQSIASGSSSSPISPTSGRKPKFPALDHSKFVRPGSVYISEPAGPNESGIRRAAHTKDKLLSEPAEGVNTVSDILDYAARVHGDKLSMGWRDILDTIEEEKEVTKTVDGKETKEMKKWKYFKLGAYQHYWNWASRRVPFGIFTQRPGQSKGVSL
ncbi:hypothetical protein CPB86DRAFT_876184 [Serendipita vermifera]|nr:hypothetical protein CPB86DRAFT_876184 [Serendipita vermifera]